MNVMKQTGHGRYNEIKNEKELITTASYVRRVGAYGKEREWQA